jgi:hypothetical protein
MIRHEIINTGVELIDIGRVSIAGLIARRRQQLTILDREGLE